MIPRRRKTILSMITIWIITHSISLNAETPDPKTYPNLSLLLDTLVSAVLEGNFPHNFNYHWDFYIIADDEPLQPITVSSKNIASKLDDDIDHILTFDEISKQRKKEVKAVRKAGLAELESYLGREVCQSYIFRQDINLGRYGYKLRHQYFICQNERLFHFEYGYAD